MERHDDISANDATANGEPVGCDMTRLQARIQDLQGLWPVEECIADHADVLEYRLRLSGEELDRSNRETIRTLIRIAAYRDDESGAHVKRIGLYAAHLAQRMGLDREYCGTILLASQLHDIGKIGISERILEKPGPLNRDEWRVMKAHAALGAKMLAHNSSPYLVMAADIARAHHERWNGSGYPDGLRGEAIPLASRITGLCDIYDTLRSPRPYKLAVDHARAASAILAGDGKTRPEYFDPAVLDAFESSLAMFRDIFDTLADQ